MNNLIPQTLPPQETPVESILEEIETSYPGLGKSLRIFNFESGRGLVLNVEAGFAPHLSAYALYDEKIKQMAVVLLPKDRTKTVGDFAGPTARCVKEAVAHVKETLNLKELNVSLIAVLNGMKVTIPPTNQFSTSAEVLRIINQGFISLDNRSLGNVFFGVLGKIAKEDAISRINFFQWYRHDVLPNLVNRVSEYYSQFFAPTETELHSEP